MQMEPEESMDPEPVDPPSMDPSLEPVDPDGSSRPDEGSMDPSLEPVEPDSSSGPDEGSVDPVSPSSGPEPGRRRSSRAARRREEPPEPPDSSHSESEPESDDGDEDYEGQPDSDEDDEDEDDDEWSPMRTSSTRTRTQTTRRSSRPRVQGSESEEEGASSDVESDGDTSSRRGVAGATRAERPLADAPRWYSMEEAAWRPQDLPFTATPGPMGGARALRSALPVDFIQLFLTDELLRGIVEQTNRYADACIKTIQRPKSRVNSWQPLSVEELKVFLGLFFLTGFVRKPELELYWSQEEMLATPFFSSTMPRNRFQIILRFLSFSGPPPGDDRDTMNKVRPVLDYLVQRFQQLYQPSQDISIDEGTLLWRGRLSFKVEDPQRPVKFGIKSYILSESSTGYCWNVRSRCGQAETLTHTVTSLLGDLAGKGYRLFMDNQSTSVLMCDHLVALGTHVSGTLRRNRGAPPEVNNATSATLRPGQRTAAHTERVLAVAWRCHGDANVVRMASTFHPDADACVDAYDTAMEGADKMEQDMAYYPFIRKSNNWSLKFVMYLFQICMFNAFVLCKQQNPQVCMYLFMQSVIKAWTTPGLGRGPRAPRGTDPLTRLSASVRLPAAHVPVHLPRTGKKEYPSKVCRVCKEGGRRRETRYHCAVCLIALHRGKCFIVYHTRLNYAIAN